MKKFWVLWTYIGNYSKVIEVTGDSPTDAAHRATGYYDEDFQKKATVYVFDHAPVFVQKPGR